MKIVTWNCNGALRKKCKYLSRYDADIYVIQESENPGKILAKDDEYRLFCANSLWIGSNKNKGLGIFAKSNIAIEKLNWNHNFRGRELQWFLPAKINSNFNIVAVWSHHADAVAFPYIGQFWLFMQNNKALFKNSIVCGDFNSNSIWDTWDRWWNHSDCVKELAEINLFSVYHQITGLKHGSEEKKTFYLQRNLEKGYHIDYIFADADLIKNRTTCLECGDFSEWKDKSDHVPILWEFKEFEN